MTHTELTNVMFREVFNKIPEACRERYGIRLMTTEFPTSCPLQYIDITSGSITILNSDKEISVSENEHCVYIGVGDRTKITMFKNLTWIYTHV